MYRKYFLFIVYLYGNLKRCQSHTTTAQEVTTFTTTCNDYTHDVIKIQSASYYQIGGTCTNDVTSILSSACDDNDSCSVNVYASVLGDPCPGVTKELSVTHKCVVHGIWGDWESWTARSPCSHSSGCSSPSDTTTRKRNCDNPAAQNGGNTCSGSDSETGSCSSNGCRINGGWGNWGTWSCVGSQCTSTGQSTSRTRSCDSPSPVHDSDNCGGLTTDTDSSTCNGVGCFVAGVWQTWSNWGTCSVTCNQNEGHRARTRSCSGHANGGDCSGASTPTSTLSESETTSCITTLPVCQVNGGWTDWGSWSACPSNCYGATASYTLTRTRTCTNPTPTITGLPCSGATSETATCTQRNCPIDGNWSDWSAWASCPSNCWPHSTPVGRTRTCTNPSVQYGGDACSGDSSETATCYSLGCPVHGGWGEWGSWNTCSVTCDTGTKNRSRVCNNPTPANGGNACANSADECIECNTQNCQFCLVRDHFMKSTADSHALSDTSLTNRYFLMPNTDNTIKCCGLISHWEFYPKAEGTIIFQIWKLESGSSYKLIGSNQVEVPASAVDTVHRYTVPTADRIAVIDGYFIGWYCNSTNMIPYSSCSSSLVNDKCTTGEPSWKSCNTDSYTSLPFSEVAVGSTLSWASGTQASDRYTAITFATVDNTDPIFNMSLVKVAIVDHTTVGTSVMPFTFTDVDVADFFDYSGYSNSHTYFLFDTADLTIKVKAALPHTVGTAETVHTYVISAKDSCDNAVTGTVTITTFNGPPEFTNLPNHVELIEGIQTEHNLFTVTVTDPSPDPVTCVVGSVLPSAETSTFSFNPSTNELKVNANQNISLSDITSYEIWFECTDGTDNSSSFLTVQVVKFDTFDETQVQPTFFSVTAMVTAGGLAISVTFVIAIYVLVI
ncbi:uncharacterized protein LOC125648132 [Ostrea edulis]|uniref:uncharacterized protein LOC125648132 n=1 Tax=Ostrea edulis TaxID=37623 RepID=UPI0024AE97A7|nr:uncharacterized protein LOC125648132 [Ostrea edulis]